MRRVRRMLSGLLAASVLAAPLPAAAAPVPLDPMNPAVAEQWVNPRIRPEEQDSDIALSLIDAPSTTTGDGTITVRVRVRNDSTESADNLTITPRRGPDSGSIADARVATIAQPSEYQVSGEQVGVPALVPGEETELSLKIPIGEQQGTTTFPLMLVLTSDGVTVDTERWHMTAHGTAPVDLAPAGLTVVYPLTAPVDIVPGETGEAPNRSPLILSSEQLTEQIAPGGRLDQLLDTYAEAATGEEGEAVKAATCLALDPALVDTVTRMSKGYSVNDDRPAPGQQRQRLRDSWGKADTGKDASPGKGTDEAAAWLVKLRHVAAGSCTVALPWANPDLNAVAQTGDKWLMREALERGPTVVEEALGQAVLPNMVIPGTGYITPQAVPAMGWADTKDGTEMHYLWEQGQAAKQDSAGGRTPANAPLESTLDSTTLPGAASVAAPEPAKPVTVLVADSTVGTGGAGGTGNTDLRFASLIPGITAATFDASLGTVLAAAGEHPETTGYSAEELRFDYTMDSLRARDLTAATAIRTATQAAQATQPRPATDAQETPPEGSGPPPTMVAPPAAWDVSTARQVMETVTELFADRTASPLPLAEYIRPPGEVPGVDVGNVGTPYEDPSVYTDTELLNAGQQARFIDDLTGILANEKGISLSRYNYTLPLRRDLLTALTVTNRRAYTTYQDAQRRSRDRLNGSRDALSAIRSSISLIPPGNVYTRTSESSPLLIVASNGLPLPVDASILYRGPESAKLNTPAKFRIPARGSMTLQMTADLPKEAENSELELFLATPQHQPISQPVGIAVRTAGGVFNRWALFAALAGLFVLAVASQLGKHRRNSGSS